MSSCGIDWSRAPRRVVPHRRQLGHGVVTGARARAADLVGAQAQHDRRHSAAVSAEGALLRLVPDGLDALELGEHFRRAAFARVALAHVHAHVVAQVREPRMHLGRERAGAGALGRIRRPELAVALRQVLEDGQRIPYRGLAVDQDRHLAGRRMPEDRVLGALLVQRDLLLVEVEAEHLHRDPWPQRPRRVVLVADDEQHGLYGLYGPRWRARRPDRRGEAVFDVPGKWITSLLELPTKVSTIGRPAGLA